MTEYITAAEYARRRGVAPPVVRRWLVTGRLRYEQKKKGRYYKIPAEAQILPGKRRLDGTTEGGRKLIALGWTRLGRIKEEAEKYGVTANALIRLAVDEWLWRQGYEYTNKTLGAGRGNGEAPAGGSACSKALGCGGTGWTPYGQKDTQEL